MNSYNAELQAKNSSLQNILDIINEMPGGTTIAPEDSSFVPTNSGGTTYNSKINDNNIDLQKILEMTALLNSVDVI